MQKNLPKQNDPTAVRRILALDLGIGSFGIAVQERSVEGDNRQFSFPIVRSCTLPGDWAELKEERTRRRMWRTRLAHIEREGWLRQVFERCGLQEAVLWGRRLKKIAVEETGPGGVLVRPRGRGRRSRCTPAGDGDRREATDAARCPSRPPHLLQRTAPSPDRARSAQMN